jgi:hypothetical protein
MQENQKPRLEAASQGYGLSMLNVDQIEEWLGQEVTDSAGERVGKLDEVFYSKGTGEAIFASVKSGMLGRHSDLVPLAGASVGRDYVRLAFTVAQIERAGSEVDVQDELNRSDALRLGELYGVDIAAEDEFEGASSVRARREALEEARKKAEALEEEARLRAADADQAKGVADSADQDAAQKAEQAERTRAEAEHARAEVDRIAPPA